MVMDPRLLEAARSGKGNWEIDLPLEDPEFLLQRTGAGRNTALHLAAKSGNEIVALDFCVGHPSLLHETNAHGDTPLHCAARAGHHSLVTLFADKMDSLRRKNRRGDTALHGAVRNCHVEVVAELLERDPYLGSMVNDSGETPLYIAAERASLVMVILLFHYGFLDHGGPGGKTALHAAACRSHDVARVLLEKKPELNSEADSSGSTPLHYVASNGDLRMAQLLLQHDASSIVYLSDKNGFSPLHVAAAMGDIHIIGEIIQVRPDSIELVDKRGRNFLHHAIVQKRPEVLRYVLNNSELEELLNEQDGDGNTPMHLAIIHRNRDIVHMLLADNRVAMSLTNNEGFTPLDLASWHVGSSIGLRMYKIMGDLVCAGSKFSPQRLDLTSREHKRKHKEEINRYRAIANNLAIVAVLIATMTFAAAFTLPGGFKSDGMATLGTRAAFKVFLISDTLAMVSSIIITCLLVRTGSWDHDVRLHSINASMELMKLAIGGMVVAFAAGIYAVVANDCQWLAVMVCITACSVPVLVYVVVHWTLFTCFDCVWKSWKGVKVFVATRNKNLGEVFPKFWRQKSITCFHTPHCSNEELVPLKSEASSIVDLENPVVGILNHLHEV